MAGRIKIIWNPISGQGIGRKSVPRMTDLLDKSGFRVEDLKTQKQGDARTAASEVGPDYHAVIAVGGDGTLNEVLNGLGSKHVPLAVFPAGTGNVFWHEIRTPRRVEPFCRMVAEGRLQKFDVGVAGGRRFICMAGAGFDAFVVTQLENMRWGNMVMAMYAVPIAQSLLNYSFSPIVVELDGKIVSDRAGSIIVGNTREYGGPVNITTRAIGHDGRFDLCIFENMTIPTLVKYGLKLLAGRHLNDRGVKYLHGERVRLHSRKRVPLQVDGDSSGFLPSDIRLLPADIPVIVSDDYAFAEK